ncbi:unnamed protein product [Coregonus sp. 'balchen']|nr:unnamed protein product [Coregonus sp. 'balchen']
MGGTETKGDVGSDQSLLSPKIRKLGEKKNNRFDSAKLEHPEVRRPPSAPRNAISNVNETSVFLEWAVPEETGGRKDVSYNILCRKISVDSRHYEECDSTVRFLPQRSGLTNNSVMVADLLAHTNYTFEVEAINGVSELINPGRTL